MKTEARSSSMIETLVLPFVSLIFVTMTIAFLTIPYALSTHPGDPPQTSTSSTNRHLT